METPYRRLLGEAFGAMPGGVQVAHRVPLEAAGVFDVFRGRTPVLRAIAARMKLPREGRELPVELRMTPEGERVRWRRQIGDDAFETVQWASGGLLVEEAGPLRFRFRLVAEGGALWYRQVAFHVGRVRLPLLLSPRVSAVVREAPGGWSVQVEVRVPFLGSVCRYGGRMRAL